MTSASLTSTQQQPTPAESAPAGSARIVASRLRHSSGCAKDGGYGYDGIPCSCGLDDRLLELGLYSEPADR